MVTCVGAIENNILNKDNPGKSERCDHDNNT